MTEPNVIRFEAKEIEPNISGHLAMLMMDTAQDGQVTVWMQRPVFVALFEQMRLALEQEGGSAPR